VSTAQFSIHFPNWPTLRVVGPDSANWLHGIITCDVKSVARGKGIWGSLLSKQGKIQADLQIVGGAEELFVAVSGGVASEVLATLDGFLVMEDAEIELGSSDWCVVCGEAAREFVSANDWGFAEMNWGTPVWLLRVSNSQKAELQALASEMDESAFSEWRIERGLPTFGQDFQSSDNLHAASLERRTVDWSKGCYLGQEVVCMQDMRGKVKKRLVGLETATVLIPGTEVLTLEGASVGEVRSSSKNQAIAMVRAPEYEPGTKLQVAGIDVAVNALIEL